MKKRKAEQSRYVAYYRVSTDKQGESGLGLAAQQDAVKQFLGHAPAAEFTEVESGKQNNREQLELALSRCRLLKAALVVAKLDRLSRNVAFISRLLESGVDFVACDNPHANKLTVHILAAVAEDEAERISQRTQAALAAAKAKGIKLGAAAPAYKRKHRPDMRAVSKAAALSKQADRLQRAAQLGPIVCPLLLQKFTHRQIADELNRQQIPTSTGKAWGRSQVARLLVSLDELRGSHAQ